MTLKQPKASPQHIRESIRHAVAEKAEAAALLASPEKMSKQCEYMRQWAINTAPQTIHRLARTHLLYWRYRAFMPGAYGEPETGDRVANAKWKQRA